MSRIQAWKTSGLLAGFATVALASSLPLLAQEPKKDQSAATAQKREYDPSRRVPSFFAQIGLTSEQRENPSIRSRPNTWRKSPHCKQITAVRQEMLTECETQLSPVQKELLGALQSLRPGKKAAKAAAKAAEAEKTVPKKAG
ncbi:MAG: hypothetical protein U0835_17045 [Isosphaeraceae bacterium]